MKSFRDMKNIYRSMVVLCGLTLGTMAFEIEAAAQTAAPTAAEPAVATKVAATSSEEDGPTTYIKGEVVDSTTLAPEPLAVIQFYKAGDLENAVSYTMTNEEGRFNQPLTGEGDYVLVYANIGKKTRMIPFTLSGQEEIDLGRILVQDDAEVLKAGTVTAQRPLVKMDVDKMSYDVENDVDSKSATLLDMLRKVPMVTVDGQDNITVNGSSNFQVYVDGKPSQMYSSNPSQIFKMMPANAFKNIEVITNPGVRYDAEGVGGVLNLTTNREATGGASVTDGIYGSVRGMASTRGYGGGLNLSAQKNKWTFGVNANLMHMDQGTTTTEVTRDQITAAGTTRMTNTSEGGMKLPLMAMGNLNASYEIDDQNLVSASAGVMRFGMDNDMVTNTSFSLLPSTQLFSYDGTSNTKMGTTNITGSVDYQHTWKDIPGRNFILSYQFSGSPTTSLSTNTFGTPTSAAMMDLTDRKTDARTGSTDHTVQADFTSPVGEKATINTGAKFLNRHNSSDQSYYLWDGSSFVLNDAGSMQYDFYNRIGAAYTEYSLNLGKVGLKAGVRYEHTWQNVEYGAGQGHDFSTNYGSLVPSASFQFNISQMSNIGLSYNMRISRPGISYLNPYVDQSDPTSRSYGNTDLEVEKAHNISLVYNYYSPKWMVNLTGRYIYTGNGISSYSFYQDNILNTTYGNIVKSNNLGLNAFVNWNAGPKTRIYFNGGASYTKFDSDVLGQSNDGISANYMLGFQQTLPADFRLSLNMVGSTRNYTLQGWSTGMGMAMAGLTKTFLDDRLSFSLTGMTSMNGMKMNMKSYSASKDYVMNTNTRIPMGQVSFSVSWTFGKNSNISVKKARKSITNDDVLNQQSVGESLGTMMMNN